MTWETVTPLTDETPQRTYWQEFKVGDRVRVRLSGECNRVWAAESALANEAIVGHPDEWNGRLGTVVPAVRPELFSHHPVGVEVEGDPVTLGGIVYQSGRFAACELEPA